MKIPIRSRCVIAFAAFATLMASSITFAQTYPAKPVRMIVPYAPGGSPDAMARMLAIPLAEKFGQQFFVENRPGAGGIAAAEMAQRAAPDGYTIFFSDIQQLSINPYLFKKLPYDPAGFTPVSLGVNVPLYMVVQANAGINSLADLVAAAKAKPGILTYGSSGVGSIHHISMESMLSSLGIQMTHVPYKGASQSLPAFVGGETTMVVTGNYGSIEPYVKNGKAKVIAVTSIQRTPQAPDVPAIAEAIPGFNYGSELGISVPKGTPNEIVVALSQEIRRVLKDPLLNKPILTHGAVILATTPEEYAENMRLNLIKFKRAMEVAKISAE